MGFDIGAGLSTLGGAVSQTAGTEALEMQKSNLENQKEVLANQLAEERETNITKLQQSGAITLAKTTSDLNVAAAKQEDIDKADVALARAPKLAAVTAKIAIQNASNPDYVKSLRTLSDASASVSERAAAAASMQQVVGLKIQNAAAQQVETARAALQRATAAGDESGIQAAERDMSVATYSAHDEAQAAATQKGVADSARMYVESLETRAARIAASPHSDSADAKAQLAQLNDEIETATTTYKSLQAQAVAAAQAIPQINLGKNAGPAAGAPSLADVLGGKPAASMPSGGAISSGATSLINSPNLGTIGGP